MGKKIALIVVIIAAIAIGVVTFIVVNDRKDPEPILETAGLQEIGEDISQLETDGLGERPSYDVDDYMEVKDYKSIPLFEETDEETEPETEDIMGLTNDMDVEVELLNRAKEAGLDTRYELDDEDAATISGQRFQTMDEYREYLAEVVKEKKEYNSKASDLSNYLNRIIENSEFSELPKDVVEYDEASVEAQVKKYAETSGTTVEKLEKEGKLENVRNYFQSQNKGYLQKEMCLRYVAEKNGIEIEDGDYEEMISFFTEIYGSESASYMEELYTEARLESETLFFKVANILF